MIWLIFIAVVILFRVLRPWIPSTILLDWFRTQRDPKWGLWAMLAGVVYFGFAYGCTVLIDIQAGWAAFEQVRRPAGRIGVVRHPPVVVA
ncbi:hypothetical protein [Microbacterium aurum]